MGLRDKLAFFFAKPGVGGRDQINNALKAEFFRCSHPKYKKIGGKVRYWRIMKRNCYPDGCTNMDSNEAFSINIGQNSLIKPTLLVPPDKFEVFAQKELKTFLNWQQKCQHRFIPFMGVIDSVRPRFDIRLAQHKQVTFRGFIITFRECMIKNIFFNDFVYLLVSEELQYSMNFAKTDTISGVGFFALDTKGMLVFSRPEKLKIIAKGFSGKGPQKDFAHDAEFRLVNSFIQDRCEDCPHALIVRVRKRLVDHSTKTVKHKSSREFACTNVKCIKEEGEEMKKTKTEENKTKQKPNKSE